MIAAVVADDITGANDCAGRFADEGYSAYSGLDAGLPGWNPQVLVRSVETRFLGPAEALRLSRGAWNALKGPGRRLDYQKMDSTLRGNPGEEILGMLEASGAPKIAFCAAYPAQGRVIRAGLVHVKGRRLDRSEYARDPLSPARSARPAALFPSGLAAEIGSFRSVDRLKRAIRLSPGRILCFDAQDEGAMRAIAKACLSLGIRHYAGASALAGALAARLGLAKPRPLPALPAGRAILVGSMSSTSLAQLQALRDSGLAPWLSLDEAPFSGRMKGAFALSTLRARDGMSKSTKPAGQAALADRIMARLAAQGLRLAGPPRKRLWLLTGGHCALSFFAALKLRGARAYGQLLPGLTLLNADGIWAASKPGGFGNEDLMKDFMLYGKR